MSIRENIGKIPAWKALAILMFAFFFIGLGVEELFISKIFHILDKSITYFENMSKEDKKEVNDDYKNFNETQEYDEAQSDLNSLIMEAQSATATRREYLCGDQLIINKLEKFYDLAYVKHNDFARKYVDKEIAGHKKDISDAIVKEKFDPSTCQEPSK